MSNTYEIYLVSDSTGETIENTVSATISQFPDVNRKEFFWPMTRTENQIKDITENIVKMIPTLIDKKMDTFSSKVNQNLNGI